MLVAGCININHTVDDFDPHIRDLAQNLIQRFANRPVVVAVNRRQHQSRSERHFAVCSLFQPIRQRGMFRFGMQNNGLIGNFDGGRARSFHLDQSLLFGRLILAVRRIRSAGSGFSDGLVEIEIVVIVRIEIKAVVIVVKSKIVVLGRQSPRPLAFGDVFVGGCDLHGQFADRAGGSRINAVQHIVRAQHVIGALASRDTFSAVCFNEQFGLPVQNRINIFARFALSEQKLARRKNFFFFCHKRP